MQTKFVRDHDHERYKQMKSSQNIQRLGHTKSLERASDLKMLISFPFFVCVIFDERNHRHLGPGYFFFFSILSIKCAYTTYMNPFDMHRCEINAFMNYANFPN